MDKQTMLRRIDKDKENLTAMAWEIFDNPECDGQEKHAADLLCATLTQRGFRVERGLGGEPNAFRATWSNGVGGPNIGILGEYDALVGLGHGCGHHLQTPAAIGAATAVKEALTGSDVPLTITVYGTPAEESHGGKIVMLNDGCFKELDAAFATHASGKRGFVGGGSLALNSYVVTFHGKSAHAAGSPWNGRSALDAMLLAFQGMEFMREHVRDGVRMHYTIKESPGPQNIVPEKAVAGMTVRTKANKELEELDIRFRKLIEGACLMTETSADIYLKPPYLARKPNYALAEKAIENFGMLGIPVSEQHVRASGGSTDFGNVSCVVPGCLIYVPYVDAPSHSEQWVAAGKTAEAEACLMNSAKMLAATIWDLVENPEILRLAKEEFERT